MDIEKALALWPDTDMDAPIDDDAFQEHFRQRFAQHIPELEGLEERYRTYGCDASFDALYGFYFAKGLYYDITPRGALSSRYAFLSLLNIIHDKPIRSIL